MDTKTIEDKRIWEDFLKKHPEVNFLQSWCWGEFHESLGNKTNHTGFFENNKLVGVMLSVVEESRRATYLTVPGGPIIEWSNRLTVELFVQTIKQIANENSCAFVRVRPQIEENKENIHLFESLGFKPAPMHLHAELTNRLDISKPKEELLSNMRKSTRYEIKKAKNLGVEVSDKFDDRSIKMFINLQNETANRQKFVPFSDKFLTRQFETFINNNLAKLYTARLKDKILAQAFIIFYGNEAVYHYGASTEEGRHYPGAYLIQWKAILEAKKRGIKIYNFWGVAPADSSSHRFAGLSLFKRGFGGQDFAYLPAHDLVINRIKYLLNYSIETLRKKSRNL